LPFSSYDRGFFGVAPGSRVVDSFRRSTILSNRNASAFVGNFCKEEHFLYVKPTRVIHISLGTCHSCADDDGLIIEVEKL
jgi:hypothetical protein